MSDAPRFRWTGVLNNYSEEELATLSNLEGKELVIDKEVGEEGTPHLHIYVNLHKKLRLSQMKALSPRAHWEGVKDRQHCIDYCSKGEVVVKRVLSQVAKRELGDAIEYMRLEGLSATAAEFPYQFVLHSRGLQALQCALIAGREKPVPIVSWYYGNTGTGKTRKAYEEVDKNNIYIVCGPNTKNGALWFDGYTGQSRVILDDFRPWWCQFSFLLRLLDRYPIQVQVKGGYVNFIPEEIIITTPKSIQETFSQFRAQEDIDQVKRRVHHEIEFKALCTSV